MKIYNFIKLFFINLLVFFALLLLVDNIIFYSAAYLPKKIIKSLSVKSQVKYRFKNKDKLSQVYEDYIYYNKPKSYKVDVFSDGKERKSYYDKFGYENPHNYLNSDKIEVLLVGDSFTEHPNFSENMRSFFKGKVYSIGVGGQGIFHWKHQYIRLKKVYTNFSNPKIIILNYNEDDDISDTLRAIKYERAGYTHSIYYPQNNYDNFEKINREYSFYHEIYSILRYLASSYKISFLYKIREKFSEFVEEKELFSENIKSHLKKVKVLPTIIQPEIGFLKYNKECKIKINRTDPKNKFFSKDSSVEIINEIQKMFELINFDETKVFFSYTPATTTIYYGKLKNDKLLKNTLEIQKKSSENFKKFFNKNKFPVIYIDITPKLISSAEDFPLHPCDGSRFHLTKHGYKVFAKLLSNRIKEVLNEF